MSFIRSRSLRLTAALAVLIVAAARPVSAQRALELQAHGVAAFADERFLGGGLGLAMRTNGRMRVGLYANAGDYGGDRAFRPELTASFHLNPYKRNGMSPYLGCGVALVMTGEQTREYLVGAIGIEWRPGAGSGWFLEAGVGGGFRVASGFQLRRRQSRRR